VIGGRLRATQTYVADANGNVLYISPTPDQIRPKLRELFDWWRNAYIDSIKADLEEKLRILARLHHGIVSLHPFLDYNGRLARLVTDQAARELLGESIAVDLTTDRMSYFNALRAADDGNLEELVNLIRAALE
jgi:fido (protein-threonine AMPylation protein)